MLDPKAIPQICADWRPQFPIPRSVYDFGYYPDLEAMLPGDLVLTADLEPDWISRLISDGQGMHYPEQSAGWTHAAMYLGTRGRLIEANFSLNPFDPQGIQVASLSDYVRTHKIRVRRLPNLTADQRWELAVSAMHHRGKPYGFSSLGTIWHATKSKMHAGPNDFYKAPAVLVCSTLYDTAVVDTLGRVLGQSAPCTPAFLSHTSELSDVNVSWKKIVVPKLL